MDIIDHNPDKTVGIVSAATDVEHIGGYSLAILKEWIAAMEAQFEVDNPDVIHLFVKRSESDCDCYALFASADGTDPLVACSGRKMADGSTWGKVYHGQKVNPDG